MERVRRTFEGKQFEAYNDGKSPVVLGGAVFRKCVFVGCHFGFASTVRNRGVVRNVSLVDSKAMNSTSLGPAIIEEVDIHHLATSGLCTADGTVFKHVRISGECGSFLLNPPFGAARQKKAWRKANDKFYEDVDWALDISEGEFAELDIRGVPADLIRRDPETQVVVRREKVESMRKAWEKRDVAGWPVSFGLMRMFDLPDMVLVAAKRSKNFAHDLAALKLLRRLGVAEPD